MLIISEKQNGFYSIGSKNTKVNPRITDSAIHQHKLANSHNVNFKIIDRAESDFKLQVKEILQIDKRKPSLNKLFYSSDSYIHNWFKEENLRLISQFLF